MTNVSRSALVGYGAQEMYALVEDVESYPQFLPWCDRAVVSVREPGRTVATLQVNFHGLREQFTTENALRQGARIDMKLVSGPFQSLDGHWTFIPLGASASKIEFNLNYRFASRVLEKTVGPAFHMIAGSFVDAFVRRARQKFGPG